MIRLSLHHCFECVLSWMNSSVLKCAFYFSHHSQNEQEKRNLAAYEHDLRVAQDRLAMTQGEKRKCKNFKISTLRFVIFLTHYFLLDFAFVNQWMLTSTNCWGVWCWIRNRDWLNSCWKALPKSRMIWKNRTRSWRQKTRKSPNWTKNSTKHWANW